MSNRGLLKKTMCIGVATIASNFIYDNLSINIDNLSGNIFLNFFVLAAAEGPAYPLAVWLAVQKNSFL